jgi:RNA polymerase sigma factor (sigma-70 family)
MLHQTTSMTELNHWDALRKGQKEALEAIYQEYVELLFQYGCKFSSDESLVKDCVQDLFIELWKNHKGLGNTTSVKRYLLASIRRKIIKVLNKNKKWLLSDRMEKIDFNLELAKEDELIKEEVKQEHIQIVKEALEGLSKRQKEVIYLKYYADLDYEEIGEIMNLNYQSLRNLVSRALKKMRETVGSLALLWLFDNFFTFFDYKNGLHGLLK